MLIIVAMNWEHIQLNCSTTWQAFSANHWQSDKMNHLIISVHFQWSKLVKRTFAETSRGKLKNDLFNCENPSTTTDWCVTRPWSCDRRVWAPATVIMHSPLSVIIIGTPYLYLIFLSHPLNNTRTLLWPPLQQHLFWARYPAASTAVTKTVKAVLGW